MSQRKEDVELVRAQLHRLVDDVEPAPDALPRLLSAARRRSARRRVPVLVGVSAALACAAFVGLALGLFAQSRSTPVAVQPDSYVAAAQPGVIAAFDVRTGRQKAEVARVRGADGSDLATDSGRVFTSVSTPRGRRVVEIAPDGERRTIAEVADGRALTAGGGRVAYVDGANHVVTLGAGGRRELPLDGMAVLDLALADDGELALLVERAGTRDVLVAGPGATTLDGSRELRVVAPCGPLAIAWRADSVAAVEPDCSMRRARVATYDAAAGRKLAAGQAFDTPPLAPDGLDLSADELGRFLVSAADRGQWLVDGTQVRRIPPACDPEGHCADGSATF
ncbi:hypothetical protein [Saccharopolyspora griseoalba]|uniref:FbpC C-terminal regulatory nucleotide binding domain-containing protein n=1 Tax=Saccharopolyspora griseoalba TaxID=1431848 RepID=A0ABW2LHV0_9PSEU